MSDSTVEWVGVDDDLIVVASSTGEYWHLEIDGNDSFVPFRQPMMCAGSAESTKALLNGAIALGLQRQPGLSEPALPSLTRYVFGLIGSYHNARRTPSNYLKAAKQFKEINRPEIAEYLEIHAKEETGHDRLVIKDLKSLKLPAETIVANLAPENVRPLYELFDAFSSADYPVGCIGYSYFIESSAALKTPEEVHALQSLCQDGVDGSRFMRCHSMLGSETDHVQEMTEFIASLPASDRIQIVRAAYSTSVAVAGSLVRDSLKSDAQMLKEIEIAGQATFHQLHSAGPVVRRPPTEAMLATHC